MASSKTNKTAGANNTARAALQAELLARPATEVNRAPGGIGNYVTWAVALAATAHEHRPILMKVPLTPDADLTPKELDDFAATTVFLRMLQDEQERRQRGAAALTPAEREALADARKEEKRVVRDLRHAFRKDRKMLSWCADVLRGDGVADLHDDVRKLTGLWTEHSAALVRFSAGKAALDRMVMLAGSLPDATDSSSLDDKRHTFLRNAAYTKVDEIAKRVCEAGRYAFAENKIERDRYRGFTSTRKAAAKKSA